MICSSEISRISHNISPEILENNGLIVALENFIAQININKNFSIDFTYAPIKRFDIPPRINNIQGNYRINQ